ncbi:uncharacterized protein LOC108914678 [Anoplophora glabripennis]|uniref:uncharacterized protein LOC108914678 n=1 Tax=Anoplophora glabripennis TaxID=217634 RepID=UPI000873F022|nr:uncharacterized protein LOC108914678 [Anoplophora glabripennis]
MNENNKTWSKQEVFSLIHLWKLHPELWDVKNKEYRNKTKKQAALRAIAAELRTPEKEIYRKFHNLRTQFHQEMRRIKARRNGDTTEDTYRTSWKYFDAMTFIMDHSIPRSVKNLGEEAKTENGTDESDNADITDIYIRPEFVELKRSQINIEEKEPSCLIRNPLQVGDKITDEFQVFGDFVASELRNLRSRENQNRLKRMIQRSILEISEIDNDVAF